MISLPLINCLRVEKLYIFLLNIFLKNIFLFFCPQVVFNILCNILSYWMSYKRNIIWLWYFQLLFSIVWFFSPCLINFWVSKTHLRIYVSMFGLVFLFRWDRKFDIDFQYLRDILVWADICRLQMHLFNKSTSNVLHFSFLFILKVFRFHAS